MWLEAAGAFLDCGVAYKLYIVEVGCTQAAQLAIIEVSYLIYVEAHHPSGD
jgi:hypothetical protein